MEDVLAYLHQIHPLSPGLREDLVKAMKHRELRKKEYLLHAGQVCRNLYFIRRGLLRCYYLKGEMAVTSWLMKEADFVTSVESFYDQAESYEYIHAVEDSEVFYISYQDFEYFIKNYTEFVIIAWQLTVGYLKFYTQQLHNIKMLKARERYNFLMEKNPDLIRRVPVTYLATYLDMFRETLSRSKDQ